LALAAMLAFAFTSIVNADSAAPAAADKTVAAWADLTGNDDAKVARALLALGAMPKETVQFLQENLFPVKADAERVKKLIADLDTVMHPEREAAAEQREYLGKYAKADLEKAVADSKSEEVKRKAKQLLERLPGDKKDPKDPAVGGGKPGAQNVQVQNIN